MGRMLSPSELAKRWNTAEKTLANWRCGGSGPAYVKLGSLVRYRLQDVEAYEIANRVEAVA